MRVELVVLPLMVCLTASAESTVAAEGMIQVGVVLVLLLHRDGH